MRICTDNYLENLEYQVAFTMAGLLEKSDIPLDDKVGLAAVLTESYCDEELIATLFPRVYEIVVSERNESGAIKTRPRSTRR